MEDDSRLIEFVVVVAVIVLLVFFVRGHTTQEEQELQPHHYETIIEHLHEDITAYSDTELH